MSLNVVAYPNWLACRNAAMGMARAAAARGKRPVLLVASYAQQLEAQKWLARHGCGFAVAVTTLHSWVCDLWELFGDGSAVVGGEARKVALWKLLCESNQLPCSAGVLNLLDDCALQAAAYLRNRQEDAPSRRHRAESPEEPWGKGEESGSDAVRSQADAGAEKERWGTCGNATCALSDPERAAVELLGRYLDQLHERGCVEHSEALALLAHEPARKEYAPLLLGVREDQLSFAQRAFLEAWGATTIQNECSLPSPVERSEELLAAQGLLFRRSSGNAPVQPGGAVRLALAAGPSASSRITCSSMVKALEQGFCNVAVTSPNPGALFEFALPLLSQRGVACSLSTRRKLCDTDMGRALCDLGQLIAADDLDDPLQATPYTAADFAYNPFSSMELTSAFKADKVHRNDRLTGQGTILSDLAGNAHDSLQGLIGLLEVREYDDALDVLEAYLNKRFVQQPAYHAEQRRVLDCVRRFCAEGPDVPFDALMQMAADTPISVNVRTEGTAGPEDVVGGVSIDDGPSLAEAPASGAFSAPCCQPANSRSIEETASLSSRAATVPCVRFVGLGEAARLEPGSVDCVIIAGLNADKYPVRDSENALTTLLGKLGVATKADPLAQSRDTFYRAFEAAQHQVVLQRCLNDENGDPSQAATVLEELLDCYRPELQTDKGMNRALGIPENLMPYAFQLGEQDVLGNAGATSRNLQAYPQPLVGTIEPKARQLIVLPFRYAEGVFDGLDVSPSQIESYLDCPYDWFAQRRLRLEGLDEGFSPMERGTFMHDVLRRFYLRFQAEVQPKVTTDTLEPAKRIMTEAFEAVSSEQPNGRFGSRYVARSAWERKEQQNLLPKLLDYLETEASLLPTFAPRAFEWQFATQRPMPYAGCNLRGCVDRIDVDDQGRAVVIDYKSSLGNEYRLYDENDEQPAEFKLPKRLQTLMYARIVREYFGYKMVGALYVNPLRRQVLGAYDATAIGSDSIPFAGAKDSKSCQVPYEHASTFDELLDECECAIAQRLTHLQAGEVEPNPAHDRACEYCPVNVCPARRVARR